jgi:hypothetical protein
MKAFAFAAPLIGFGAFTLVGTLASSVPAAAKCMIEEGAGCYTPCSAPVKRQKKTAKQ